MIEQARAIIKADDNSVDRQPRPTVISQPRNVAAAGWLCPWVPLVITSEGAAALIIPSGKRVTPCQSETPMDKHLMVRRLPSMQYVWQQN